MKRYNNIASQIVILFPLCSIAYLLIMILFCIYSDGQLIDLMVICIGFIVLFFFIWIALFIMKDDWIITYYDGDKIYQKCMWKKKTMQYDSIKEIYVSGSYIYITSKIYNLEFDKKGTIFQFQRNVYKMLKNEIVIMITSDPLFLKYISLEKINIHKFKNSISNLTNKYF